MEKLYFKGLEQHYDETVTLEGFVDNLRDLQYVQFLILRDGTDKVQVTVEKNEENVELNKIVSSLTIESTVKVVGKLLKNEKVKMGGKECIPTSIEITSISGSELPIDLKDKEKTLRETRLDYRFLDLRREENALLFQVQTTILNAMRNYWYDNGFIEIASPKISAASAEGGSEVFKLDYFGKQASLSQSPQLYKQMAMASGFNKVFEIGQVFRAENSHTSYHASEILMVDAEISWVNNVHDVCDMQEAWVKSFMTKLKEQHGEDIKRVFGVEVSDVSNKFPRITFREAKNLLKETYQYVGSNENDFERKEEELVGKWAKDTYNSDFVFVTNYPYETRPFYSHKLEDGTSDTYDLLFKGLEITSGAKREHRHDILKEQIIGKGINPESLAFYLEFFQYGCPPHGGFGFGLSRLMMLILNIDNIREATFVYRGPTRLNP